ncbi:unnamed protein product [Adineta steineri]|uniref:Uncharacterized protein n=2 Tax=Adineta steineri TaxID=433720 RepID=A0A818G8N6_9BILA|nr:unnamed protein product [Adineta steineri]
MDSTIEPSQSPLVVFGPDHIDTSRAEILVQRLNEKIKEKRFKLKKIIGINEEKKKRNEMMKNEKIQLTAKLANIEQENSVREQQLLSEQARIKELQFNIQMIDDHNISIKRDSTNEEQKYEQEKSILIQKFERTKQQWIEIFKPQYEQSKVYQYLKQGDTAYNVLAERKETLLNTKKLAYKNYFTRRQEFCDNKKFQLSIQSIAKYFILRRDQFNKIKQMKEKLIELENKEKQLIESKNDKMKAWENIYTQPMKRDLMDFCLQTNIDQALTLSFNQIQQDIWSQPMTPSALTPQNEQIEFLPEEEENNNNIKSSISFHSTTSTNPNESVYQVVTPSVPQLNTSTITVVPNKTELNRSSVLHLTTAIDDDDVELFSTTRRKIPIIQLEQMNINDGALSTQAFVVSAIATSPSIDVDREVSSISQNDQASTSTSIESPPLRNLVTPTVTIQTPESMSIPLIDTATTNKLHSTIAFSRVPNKPGISAIQPQVTSNDVQQMLLTFSPDPSSSSIHEEQTQPMEDDSVQTQQEQQQQQQQRPTFSMASSIESTPSTEKEYTNFNYNFGFDNNATNDSPTDNRDLPSPINFGNWAANLGSPITTGSNEQFSAFLQQTNSSDNGADNSFSFASFNYANLGGTDTSTDGAFGSFFFGNNENSMANEQKHDGI